MRLHSTMRVARHGLTATISISVWLVATQVLGDETPSVPECLAELLDAEVSHAAAFPQEVPEAPCGRFGASRYVFRRNPDGKVLPILVEGPRGPQVRVAVSYQQLKALQVADGPLPPAWQMSREALAQLVDQLDTVRASTEKYQDVNVAMAEGYVAEAKGESPGMGLHFQHPGRMTDGRFNPAEPEMLLYTRALSETWQLIGTAFILPREQVGDDHPDGFIGPLDNWHVHYNLCVGTPGRWLEPQACVQRGGRSGHGFGWMVHAWVWEENANGIFAMHHSLFQEGDAASAHEH